MRLPGLALAAFAAVLPLTLLAQSMDEAARKEARRRAEARASGIHATFTNQDLEARGGASEAQGGSRANDPSAVPSPSPSPAGRAQLDATFELRRVAEASWRRQAREARARLEEAQDDYDAVKYQWRNPTSRCALTSLQGSVDQAKRNLAAAQKQLDALEESARHAGIPPGWIR